MRYEYKVVHYFGDVWNAHGAEKLSECINQMVRLGWEYVSMNPGSQSEMCDVLLTFRRPLR